MSTSTITLYNLKKSFAGKNLIVEDLSILLSDSNYIWSADTHTISNFQYLRLQKEMTIKISYSQVASEPTYPQWNYCRIHQDSANTYYFITSKKQIAQSTIEVQLVMDVLNTFHFADHSSPLAYNEYVLSPKTHILRRHKDRIYTDSNYNGLHYAKNESYSTEFLKFVNNETVSSDIYFSISIDNVLRATSTWETIQATRHRKGLLIVGRFTAYLINGSYIIEQEYSTTPSWIYFYKGYIRYGKGLPNTANFITIKNFSANDLEGKQLIIKMDTTNYVAYYYNPTLLEPAFELADSTYIKSFTKYFEEYSVYEMNGRVFRHVDNYPENINPVLFTDEETILYDKDGYNSWYLIYSNNNSVVSDEETSTNPVYVNPVSIDIVCDNKIYQDSNIEYTSLRFFPSMLPQKDNEAEYLVLWGYEANADSLVTIDGDDYHVEDYYAIVCKKTNNSDTYFSKVWLFTQYGDYISAYMTEPNYTNIAFIDFYKVDKYEVRAGNDFSHRMIQGYTLEYSHSGEFSSWNDIDLKDERLIKAINIPYAPLDKLVDFNNADTGGFVQNGSNNALELVDSKSVIFDRIIAFDNDFFWQDGTLSYSSIFQNGTYYNLLFNTNSASVYNDCESKLYHGDFFMRKFVYDVYSFTFTYDYSDDLIGSMYSDGLMSKFYVRYYVSKNMLSRFMFEFPQYTNYKDRWNSDYPKTLIIDRNNEKALYNNAYINYIKNGGYAYDSNKNQKTNQFNALTTALQIGGSIAGTAIGIASGNPVITTGGIALAVSSVTSIARNIKMADDNDRALARKLTQMSYQATSVNANDDIEIFSAIDGNKAKLVKYEVSPEMKKALLNLFHYYGYATNETRQPTSEMLHSRIYFNFIQAEIEFSVAYMPTEYQELIKQKWLEGVTFVHLVEYNNTDTWDIDQEYQNWETSLL